MSETPTAWPELELDPDAEAVDPPAAELLDELDELDELQAASTATAPRAIVAVTAVRRRRPRRAPPVTVRIVDLSMCYASLEDCRGSTRAFPVR
jgi:hypothetical protein